MMREKNQQILRAIGGLDDRLIQEAAPQGRVSRFQPRRIVAVAAAAVLAVALATGALAAGVPGFRAWLFGESGLGAGLTEIVAQAQADQTRLEVLGAMSDGAAATVYFTLADESGEGRMDGDLSVHVTPSLRPAGAGDQEAWTTLQNGYWTKVLSVDQETGTALCRLDVDTGGLDLSGMELGLTLYNYTVSSADPYVPLDLSLADADQETLPIDRVYQVEYEDGHFVLRDFLSLEEQLERDAPLQESGAGGVLDYASDGQGGWVVLRPREDGSLPAGITAMGFIDGKLHLQSKGGGVSGEEGATDQFDLHCADAGKGQETALWLARQNANGDLATDAEMELGGYKALWINTFDLDENGAVRFNPVFMGDGADIYTEYVFDVTPQDFADFEFYGVQVHTALYRPALSVTVPLGESLAGQTVSYAARGFDRVDATPISVFLTGKRSAFLPVQTVELVYGGEVVPARLFSPGGLYRTAADQVDPDEDVTAGYVLDGAPRDPAQLTAIRLDGVEIPLA